ncbi:MAG: isocitrate/isopropylmalate family dehydrogenase, partial [Thermoproteus sp.]
MRLAVIPGDGIGPEVVSAAMRVVEAAARRFSIDIEAKYVEAGDG